MSVSAAAMARAGKGNYQTCYNNIVKFQILDEIESLFEMRLDKGHENTVNQLQVGTEIFAFFILSLLLKVFSTIQTTKRHQRHNLNQLIKRAYCSFQSSPLHSRILKALKW